MLARKSRKLGFALPAVLAVTGVVTIVFLVAITALASMTAEANAARARVRFMERALTAEAAISMLAVTEPYAPSGIEVGGLRRANDFLGETPSYSSGLPVELIALDGRSYRMTVGAADLLVGLRDQAGMVNVPRLTREGLDRLGRKVGIRGLDQGELWERLADYIDGDDLKRVGGAERQDYPDAAIGNRRLLTGPEWLSVLGVREAVDPQSWRAARGDIAADSTQGITNANTASPLALEVTYGLSPAEANSVIEAREDRPLLSLADLETVVGRSLGLDPLGLYTYPSGRIIFTIRDTQSRWVYRGRFIISPGDPDQPFWVDQTEIFEGPNQTSVDVKDAPDFPYPTH